MGIHYERAVVTVLCALGILSLASCSAFRASTSEVDVREKRHFTQEFDYSDLRDITESVASELVASPVLGHSQDTPVLMIAGVQNRTSDYVDTKNLTDRIRTLLFKSGKLRFANETRREDLLREQGYQAAHATPESQVAVGRQLGARYMLSGSLAEMKQVSPRQARLSKQKLNYYKLTMEMTDLESGELVWTTEREFAREASLPLIGW
jgi:uncharacterized protein (TIGR02722 family)